MLCFELPSLVAYLWATYLSFTMKFHFLIGFFFSLQLLMAQESTLILMRNGKYLEVYSLNDSSYVPLKYSYDSNYFKKERINLRAARKEGVLYTPDFSSPKAASIPIVLKKGTMARDQVFSIQIPSGKEIVYYQYSEPLGNYLTEDQMRAFVYGRRDARFYHRGSGWFYSGLGVGLLAGYGLKTSILSLAVPPLFALTTLIPTIHIKESQINDKSFKYNLDYAAGFESYARSRNTIQALKGSAIGTVVGIIIYSIVDNNR